jgi:hypothetical protein
MHMMLQPTANARPPLIAFEQMCRFVTEDFQVASS